MQAELKNHLESLRLSNEHVREVAIAALEDFGPPLASDVAPLAHHLSDATADVAYWSATLLGRLGEDARDAVRQLAATLADADRPLAVRERSAWALGKIGSAARDALAQLQAAEQSGESRLARLASAARQAIE